MGEKVVAKDIGREDFSERRLIVLAVVVFGFRIPGACLSSSRLAGGAKLVSGVGD